LIARKFIVHIVMQTVTWICKNAEWLLHSVWFIGDR